MSELSQKDIKWNKLWDLWAEEKLESPYDELMKYSAEINNGGHLQFFDNVAENYNLELVIKNLYSILPQNHKNNLQLAYKTYLINTEDISDENNAILDECDNFFYDNEMVINKLLEDRASKIIL